MYGMYIPIVFPIALIGIIIKYFMEKMLITYWYRKPPMYNEKLSRIAINILTFAPILLFIMGYWALGNQ
jgi:hypothetical protein